MAKIPSWAFDDLALGQTFPLGPKHVTAEEIIAFASEFDMQPMHLDEAAGKASLLGGLAASGWHTCSMFMRMVCDALLLDSTSQGAPGVEYARWRRPVLAGDTLSGETEIVALRRSEKRPRIGYVTCRHRVWNQHGDIVLELENAGMFLTREAVA